MNVVSNIENPKEISESVFGYGYNETDIDKTYTYTISEVNDSKDGYTYDSHVYTAKVKIDKTNNIITVTPDAIANDILTAFGGPTKITRADKSFLNGPQDSMCTGFIVEDKYSVVKKGDVNGDGYVDTGDTLNLKRVLLNLNKFNNDCCKKAADVNNDSYVDTGDTLLLKRQLLGLSNISL